MAQTINESDREGPVKEEVNNENGKKAEAEDEVTYLSLSGDEDFASEAIVRENFLLIGANTKYGRAVRVNISPEKQYLVILMFNNLVWKLMSIYDYKKV